MLCSLVRFVVQNRNLFPPDDGISATYGPTTIVTGLPIPSSSYFGLEFGEYVHTHDHSEVTNDVEPARTTPAIALGPSNRNGEWSFMSLLSGKRIIRSSGILHQFLQISLHAYTSLLHLADRPARKNGLISR